MGVLTKPGQGAHADRGRSAGSALAWSFANVAVGRLGTIAIGIALARILGPAEFGTYAVAFVAVMAILSFNELGVSLAIVRWQRDPREIAPTVNTVSWVSSLVLTAVVVLAAPAFATAMGDPEATPLVQLMSLCILINGVVATPAALLQRYFRQDQRLVADQVNTWVGAIVSIVLAMASVGAMSLVVGRLAGSVLSAFLFLSYSPLPYRLGWNRLHVRPLLQFGLPLAGASIIVFLVGFADQLVIGAALGAVMLGYYVQANNLASWPVTMFSQPVRMVSPALFARLQHDRDQMRGAFRSVLRPLAAVSLPACAAISATSTEIIRFLYGPAWLPAAQVLAWLAWVAAVRIIFELIYDFLVVVGRTRQILLIQVAWVVSLLPAIVVGIRLDGVAGAAAGVLSVALLVSLPLYARELHHCSVRGADVLHAVVVPVGLAAVTWVGAAGVSALPLSAFPTLAVCGLFTVAVIALGLWRYRRDLDVLRSAGG